MNSFDFVKNIWLNEKLKETYSYIKFLLSLERKNINKDILISLNRDIIIHTTSILEWIIMYLVLEIYNHWNDKEKKIIYDYLIKKEYVEISLDKELTIFKWTKELKFVHIKKIKWKLNWKLNLGILINYLKKLWIFSDNILIWLDDIQKIRNDLHLQKILDSDIYENELTDEKMLELFDFTRLVQSEIINKLNEIKK